MRFERTTAVLVLATGVIFGGVMAGGNALAQATPDHPTAPPPMPEESPNYPPGQAHKVGSVPWNPVKLKSEHALLKELSGRFTTKVHVYSGPYRRLYDTEGTAEGKLVMDGAFVELSHAELRMKYPFQGMTVFGFDVAIGKYTADTIDNTSTAIVHSVGTYDAGKKELVMTGHFSDQQSRALTIIRTVCTFTDAKTWTYDEYVSHKVGEPETRVVTIVFTRL
jgi:hypothetical protein